MKQFCFVAYKFRKISELQKGLQRELQHVLQGPVSLLNIALSRQVWLKEYSPEVSAELPQTMVADSQPSPRAGRLKGLVELSAREVWGNQP